MTPHEARQKGSLEPTRAQLVSTRGRPDLALVFLLQLCQERWSSVECVGALDPAVPRSQKMVIVVSSQFGCPMGCTMCDAGTEYHGNLSAEQIHEQIAFVIEHWAGPGLTSCPKLKVQFARMGEPALNRAVLRVLRELPARLQAPGLMPCIATVAPSRATDWLESLLQVRRETYGPGQFQLQFSVQSTSAAARRQMIPAAVWDLERINGYAQRFVQPGDRKVVLNFALAQGLPVEPEVLARLVSPDHCLIKLTPLNPTDRAARNGWRSVLSAEHADGAAELVAELRAMGFDCIVSIGAREESDMGSSCGQLAMLERRGLPVGRTEQARPV
jgi:23S rRNA (adenine2503-C2)-methyltransferase